LLFTVLQRPVVITAFVAVMMLVVEYANVQTQGLAQRTLQGSRLRQYALAALLGATPGCLGAYVLVTLHIQRSITLGALVAGMIATSGDELFVMAALFPGTAATMTAGLALVGILAGWLTDSVAQRLGARYHHDGCCSFQEDHGPQCECLTRTGVSEAWHRPTISRLASTGTLLLFVTAIGLGYLGPAEWGWKRAAFFTVGLAGLFIVSTVPEPFLADHVLGHLARRHVPRIFLWTFAAVVAMALLEQYVDVRGLIADNPWTMLLVAAAVGIAPESGPHLVFVTLYADGALPLSILVASSTVQDGHGMLPLLAHSRRDFVVVKAINLATGLAVGAAMLAAGH